MARLSVSIHFSAQSTHHQHSIFKIQGWERQHCSFTQLPHLTDDEKYTLRDGTSCQIPYGELTSTAEKNNKSSQRKLGPMPVSCPGIWPKQLIL